MRRTAFHHSVFVTGTNAEKSPVIQVNKTQSPVYAFTLSENIKN